MTESNFHCCTLVSKLPQDLVVQQCLLFIAPPKHTGHFQVSMLAGRQLLRMLKHIVFVLHLRVEQMQWKERSGAPPPGSKISLFNAVLPCPVDTVHAHCVGWACPIHSTLCILPSLLQVASLGRVQWSGLRPIRSAGAHSPGGQPDH